MPLVAPGHMLLAGSVSAPAAVLPVAGDTLAPQEDLHSRGGMPYLHLLANQLVGYAVVVACHR